MSAFRPNYLRLCFIWSVLLWSGIAAAVETTLTREQQLNLLVLSEQRLLLEQRREARETYRQEWDIAQELHDKGFMSLQDYKKKKTAFELASLRYEDAAIDYDQVKLDLLDNATYIIVTEARKYKTDDGKNMVDLTLKNASDTRDALLVDSTLTKEELRILLKVENIFVSLERGATVGEPYEVRIDSLAVDEVRTLTYRLLKDSPSVNVVLNYLEKTDNKSVILTKGSQQDLPTINSSQFSQEGELNDDVDFGLTLERLSDDERSFALAVVGLPQRIDFSFNDQGAKVNQVKFDENTSQIKLSLNLEIPEKIDRRFIGATRTFYALVTHPSQYAQINALRARYDDDPVPEKEVKTLKANYVKLELTPKGVGELEVLISNRYQEIKVGDSLRLRVEFLNRGSEAVQNIKAALDLPYEWESEAEPSLIRLLEPDERAPIAILAIPPGDIAVGDYELGIEAQGQVGTEDVQSLEKNITIRIGARSNIAGTTILIGILVLVVVGLGLASIKISRR